MPVNRDLPRQRGEHMQTSCDFCAFNEYDDEDEEYYCSVNMEEDEFAIILAVNVHPWIKMQNILLVH